MEKNDIVVIITILVWLLLGFLWSMKLHQEFLLSCTRPTQECLDMMKEL